MLIVLCSVGYLAHAQKIASVNYPSSADVNVFVVAHESQADLKVFKVDYESQAKGNKGWWYFVDYPSRADKRIYFVDYPSKSDVKIYFVSFKSRAGWRDAAKKHLFY